MQGGKGRNAGQGSAGGGGGYFGGGGGNGNGFAEEGGGGGSGFLSNSNVCSSLSTSAPVTSTSYQTPGAAGSTPEGSSDIDYNGTAGKTAYGRDGEDGSIVIYMIP